MVVKLFAMVCKLLDVRDPVAVVWILQSNDFIFHCKWYSVSPNLKAELTLGVCLRPDPLDLNCGRSHDVRGVAFVRTFRLAHKTRSLQRCFVNRAKFFLPTYKEIFYSGLFKKIIRIIPKIGLDALLSLRHLTTRIRHLRIGIREVSTAYRCMVYPVNIPSWPEP